MEKIKKMVLGVFATLALMFFVSVDASAQTYLDGNAAIAEIENEWYTNIQPAYQALTNNPSSPTLEADMKALKSKAKAMWVLRDKILNGTGSTTLPPAMVEQYLKESIVEQTDLIPPVITPAQYDQGDYGNQLVTDARTHVLNLVTN